MRLLTLLKPELADWAVLALPDARTGVLRLQGGEAVGFTATVPLATIAGTRLDRLLRTGNTDVTTDARDPALAGILPQPLLRGELLALGLEQLLAVGLNARGATLGALLLARRGGFDAEDIEFATRLASRAAIALDSARLYEERGQIATVLSGALRPPSLPDVEHLRLAARYRPAAEHIDLGGDFYDVLGSDRDWLITLGDVCGKGVVAAAATGRTRQSIRTAAHFDRHPAALLRALNSVLYEAGTDQFVTVLCARVNVAADGAHADVELATAGHPAPILLRADGHVEHLEIFGAACGMVPGIEYRTISLRLHRGDTMLMFTDGVDEAHGAQGLFGVDRLLALLPAFAGAAPDVICEAVEQHVVEYVDGRPHDDIAMLAVTCGS
ncbi:PP2C family protein-serine/threonine phosphatase [Mycolicibacterium chubuense]|uniref:Phosphoserine phosphatase RsbU n=1 Tax=Mycolicibacterium chubuense TaxID=1800 RepID=A0A0J6VUH8_MYCCU|nr:GAF domain-containing SpoIIE family protein phosphatase [Mycolicibacterium chubuense]KMO73829.1 Phosphoserine phosphatase RsbU [Mycolicibacterium chubuense]SPX97631.1 serine phosphatase RsbU, regulator of sigma subunit [Mycolicibacterium chubuense]